MSNFTLKRKFPITANPQGTSTDSLTKIGIGNDIYDVGSGNANYVEVTQAQYDALSSAEKNNGTLYFITDAEGGGGNSGVQIPAIIGTKFHYNGIAQAPVITGFDSTHCTVTGTTSATNIGQYTITISLSEGLSWSDGTSAAKTYTYEIIPIGVKYTPTDDVQTWLACAEIWDKTSYTTLADVLADSDTLEALLANGNAVDYLVRSTTWISSICSDEDTMTAIGDSDVCADKLLENYEWIVGICNSTYFESVLNVKVPTMTSDTTPSGVGTCFASTVYNNDNNVGAWRAFDKDTSSRTYWNSAAGDVIGAYVGFEFPNSIKVCKFFVYTPGNEAFQKPYCPKNIKLQGSNDGTTWADIGSYLLTDTYSLQEKIAGTSSAYTKWRVYVVDNYGATSTAMSEVQFYGRASSSIQPVDMPYQASSLSYLRDVVITDEPKDGDILRYNKSISKWTNETATEVRPNIYGVMWDGQSSPTWTRTGDATFFVDPVPQMSNGSGGWTQGSSPFDTISPWKDMVVSERTGGTMVSIPKFYFKLEKAGSVMSLMITAGENKEWALRNGYQISPAHMDRGDGKGERDVVYVSRYHCASDYKSKTGVSPLFNKTSAQFRSGISSLGTGIYQWDILMYFTIQMLYLVEYAHFDSQRKIGYGCSSSTSTIANNGMTDNMTYHTGTDRTSLTTYGYMQYRNIENLWANGLLWIDGLRFSSRDIYFILNPSEFSDTTGGYNVGTRTCPNGNISSFDLLKDNKGNIIYMFPLTSVSNSSYNTYICDSYYNTNGTTGTHGSIGGNWNSQGLGTGIFQMQTHITTDAANQYETSKLMELP